MKENKIFKLIFIILLGVSIFACNDEFVPETTTQKVNKFIYDAMNDVYYWYNKMPDIDYKNEPDSKDYFYKLLYEEDKWSYITDDVVALENSSKGIEKSFGWSLAIGDFTDQNGVETGNLFAVVKYVYRNTPAANAGLQRGDIILKINNSDITDENYTDLWYADNLTITLIKNDGINDLIDVSITSLVLNLNPVVETRVVEHAGKKIGYLFYAEYISNYNNAIDTALQNFIDEGVNYLVLDLRYNLGGLIDAAQHLCSSIAPASVVNDENVLVRFEWNDKYQSNWVKNQIMSQIEVKFDKIAPVKMNLNEVHVLTGSRTASASELTITGLRPYMKVTTVGDTTAGKYTGSILIKPERYYSESYAAEINNWGIRPIVLRYANTWGQTDFKDGFAPDIEVYDDLLNAYPLGDFNDPLFAAAIEDITGTSVVSATKSTNRQHFPYGNLNNRLPIPENRDRELIIDWEPCETLRQSSQE